MADARQVPPTPGTEPRASKHRERPHREDAGIYSLHREKGTHPYTQDEIEARIVANAADAAAAKSSGPLDVPFLRELVAVFRHRLLRDLPLSVERRLTGRREVVGAEVEEGGAAKERERLQRRRSELESIRRRTPRPVGGRKFTHPAWLFACFIPAVAIELLGSKSALEAAFDL
ncbi:MAG TPA: hypothetical protein VLQ45_28285, partial [Thermoanaerobaculia bacterium]|nr:hypothetical protein [Thermoanaerobaculia bacterium]